MPLPVLYSFCRCPYAIRARLALRYAGIKVALREVALRSKPAELLVASPKGTVPVLQLSSGEVLEESMDIMRWALAQADPQGWLSPHGAAGDDLIAINDGPFKVLLDRYKYANRDAGRGSEKTAAEWRDAAVEMHIAPLTRRLQTTPYLFGEKPVLADMALLPFVRQFAQVDAEWFADLPYPALRAWLEKLLSTELFASVMDKRAPWKAADPVTIF